MDFTDLYRHTHAQVSFSPGRHFILTAINDRIVVRKSSTFTITASFQADLTPSTTSSVLAGKPSARLFAAEASISQCTWSPDSEYILAACPRRGVVNIFALRDTTWNARIEAGIEGLVRVEWAPDSRHILCFSEFGVRTQVIAVMGRSDRLYSSCESQFGLLLPVPRHMFSIPSFRRKVRRTHWVLWPGTGFEAAQDTSFETMGGTLSLRRDTSPKT